MSKVCCISEMQLFVFLLSNRSEQILNIDRFSTGFAVLGLRRRLGDHGSVKFEKNEYQHDYKHNLVSVNLFDSSYS